MKRLLILFVLLVLGCSQSQSPAGSFKFTFKPPDAAYFDGTVIAERKQIMGDSSSVDSNWTYSHHTILATPEGFELTTYTDSTRISRDGAPVEDPIVGLLSKAIITSLIDSSGNAIAVRGYEAVFELIDSALDAKTAAAVRQVMAPEMLSAQEIQEWNNLIGSIAGLEMSIGEITYDTISTVLTRDLSITTFQATHLVDTLTINNALCAKLRIQGHSDPNALAARLELPPLEIAEAFGLNDSLVNFYGNQQITSVSSTEVIFEIATLMVHSEVAWREMNAMINMADGQAIYSAMIETQNKQFSFGDASGRQLER